MAFEVIIWIVNILCILHVRQVTSQAAVLDIENCENSTLAGNNINITFRLKDGSFPALALLTVQFYRNGVKPTPDCIVERTIPCNTAGIPPYCGCTEDGTDKVFYYEITSVSVNQAGDWTTAVEHVNDPTQTIRSPVCQLTVTSPTTTMPTTIASPTTDAISTEGTSSGCQCPCPCHCPTSIGVVIALAITTTVLIAVLIASCFINDDGKMLALVIVICVFSACVVAFLFAVGFSTVHSEKKCDSEECREHPCCTPNEHYCPDAFKASIAFLVIGTVAVISAIVYVITKCCCNGPKKPRPKKPRPEEPTKISNETANLEHLPSPNRLPPMEPPEAGDKQPDSERKKKKKKSKKSQPEGQELRPLPIPQTELTDSLDVPVNMSGSNTSPLPMRSNFTFGQQASGEGENAMPPVGSSSLKRNDAYPQK